MNVNLLESIADPIRLEIVRRLAREGPASLQELADAAGVHVNTARAHVTALEEAGALDSQQRDRSGRGRPGVEYVLNEGWALGSEDFLAVAEVLATAVVRAGMSSEDLLALGREWGRYMVGRPGAHDAQRELLRALERFGYLVELDGRRLNLSGCPCALVSPEEPRVVCDLAMGIADGVLEMSQSELRVGERRHHHAARHCEVTLTEHK